MNKALTFKQIPVIHVTSFDTQVDPVEIGLPVSVDGRKAHIYEHRLNDGFYQREKIVIQFAEKHPKWEHGLFQTKYYEMNEPGKLEWGNNGAVMHVECLNIA